MLNHSILRRSRQRKFDRRKVLQMTCQKHKAVTQGRVRFSLMDITDITAHIELIVHWLSDWNWKRWCNVWRDMTRRDDVSVWLTLGLLVCHCLRVYPWTAGFLVKSLSHCQAGPGMAREKFAKVAPVAKPATTFIWESCGSSGVPSLRQAGMWTASLSTQLPVCFGQSLVWTQAINEPSVTSLLLSTSVTSGTSVC